MTQLNDKDDMEASLADNLPKRLRDTLSGMPKIALAFSGGVDSRFLAHAAMLCGCEVLAIHAFGPHMSREDNRRAKEWADARGIEWVAIDYDPFQAKDVCDNSHERCYACKKGFLQKIKEVVDKRDDGPWTLCDGGQMDDVKAYRPGTRAVEELGAISPLKLAGMNKMDIRAAGRITGLDNPGQKSRPCLLTRFVYGLRPTPELLVSVAKCEADLDSLLGPGVDYRVRLTPEPVLQVAGNLRRQWPKARDIMASHGFSGAELYECDSVSGYFDRDLQKSA